MTPKEKAAELLKIYNFGSFTSYSVRCSIICVEQILKLDCLTDEGWLNVPQEYKEQYWREVKQELEKLL